MSLKKSAEQFLENFQKIETRLGELGDQLDQDFVKSIADEGGNVVCGPTKIITYSSEAFDDLENELKSCQDKDQSSQYLKALMDQERSKATSAVQSLFRSLGMELLPTNP